MTRLPSLTPRQVVAALKKAGFEERRRRGSHLFLWRPDREVVAAVYVITEADRSVTTVLLSEDY